MDGGYDSRRSRFGFTERADVDQKDAPEYFKSAYGGFGNYAWKNIKIKFIRDDSAHSFIFGKRGKNYRIKCSVIGVYNEVKAKFGTDTARIQF